MQFQDHDRVYIEGPTYTNGQTLNGNMFKLFWEQGYSGPHLFVDILRKAALIPGKYNIISEYDYLRSPAGAEELSRRRALLAFDERSTVVEAPPVDHSIDLENQKNIEDLLKIHSDANHLAKMWAKRRLMGQANWSVANFEGEKEAWAEFEKEVLPQTLEELKTRGIETWLDSSVI